MIYVRYIPGLVSYFLVGDRWYRNDLATSFSLSLSHSIGFFGVVDLSESESTSEVAHQMSLRKIFANFLSPMTLNLRRPLLSFMEYFLKCGGRSEVAEVAQRNPGLRSRTIYSCGWDILGDCLAFQNVLMDNHT